MKIGIDCRIYSSKYTGIGRYVFELTNRLFKMDQENEYVLFFNNPEFEEFQPPNDRVKKVLFDVPIYSYREQTDLLKIINKEELDLMHFTHFNAPIRYKRTMIVTIHDLTLSYYPGKKKKAFIQRLAYNKVIKSVCRKSKFVITISENSKNDIINLLKIPEDKIRVIHQAVGKEFHKIDDEDSIQKTLTNHGIRKPYLLYTGVWRTHKNLPNLIHAFKELLEKPDCKNLQLVITGKEDPQYPEVKETTEALKMTDVVKFTGLVNETDLINLYNAAEIYVLPSFYEGFGLTPLEAMACETPVACSNTSSLPEICGEGNAIFFDPNDVHDMANKIYTIYVDENLKQKLIANGLKRVQNFSWQKMAEETFKLYKKCSSR